jgi:hypothetical protein
MLWVLIAVQRGCISKLCGVRQRHARWAQKLKSTIQGRPMRLLNTSGGKAMEKNTVADRISEEFCEALPGGH